MADTVTTLSALQALFADNILRNISEQDARDFIVSAMHRLPVTEINDTASPYTASENESVIVGDATSGAITVNLPAVATARVGAIYVVKKEDSSNNVVTVDASGAETIDSATTYSLIGEGETVTLINDGDEWHVIAQSPANIHLSVTAAITLPASPGRNITIDGDTTGGAFTITLAPAANCKGMTVVIVKTDANANAITLDADGAELINGSTTLATGTSQYDIAGRIVSDGSQWYVID
jgi:hypothetical protein